MRVPLLPLAVVLLLVAGAMALPAQVRSLRLLEPATQPARNTATAIPLNARLLRINTTAFDGTPPIATDKALIENFLLPDGSRHTLELERFDVIDPTGMVVEGTRNGDRPVEMEKHLIFAGTVKGMGGSHVYLAFFRTFAFGMIEIPQPGTTLPKRILIAPDNLDNPVPTMIVYDESDVPLPNRPPYHCSAPETFTDRGHDLENLRDELFGNGGKRPAPRLQNAQILAAQIGVECEYSFYNAHNKNLSRAANYAIVLMGAVSSVYQRDVRIALQVPYLRVWTTESNPFPGPGDGDLLNQLRNHWLEKMTGVKRTSAIILTSYRGGVAWVGAMCGDYGFAQAGPGGNFNFPTSGYVWDIDVVAHELGHNFGSPHTHSCFWNPAVDSCWAAEGACFSGTYPHPGTIMSYCHLTVGTVATFHPRVATLVRAACERYGCMAPLPATAPKDIAAVAILAPPNGSAVKRFTSVTPSARIRNVGTAEGTNITVSITIRNPAGTSVYTDSKIVATLASGTNAIVAFKPVTLGDMGVYMASIEVKPDDTVTANNVLTRPFEVVETPANASMMLTTQNAGETYLVGTTAEIRWEQVGVAELSIELSPDNGASWRTVQWSQRGDSGRYIWTIPALPTREALIRITNMNDARIWDQSDRPFVIAVDRDVQALEFVQPFSNDTIASPFVPKATIRHNGTVPLTNVPVQLKLIWRPGDLTVYDTTVIVPALAPGTTHTVEFPQTRMLPQGNMVMIARTRLAGDRDVTNDSLARTAEISAGLSPPTAIFTTGLDGAVALTWPASTSAGVTGYRLYRGTDPEALSLIASFRPTVLAHVDDPLANDSLYYYAVSAMRSTEESMTSPVAVGDPVHQIAGEMLGVPALLHPADAAVDLPLPVHLVWRSLRGAELYQIQIAADAACTDVIANYIAREPKPALADVIGYGGSFHWRMRGFNNSSRSPWSSVWRFSAGQSCAGTALRFTGGQTGVIDTAFAWNGGPVTVEFWNYVASSDLVQASTFGVGPRDDGANRFQAHVPWDDRNVYWDYGDIGRTGGRLVASYAPYLDKWTHVALVSNAKDFRAIYFNGELAAVATDTATVPTPLAGLRIGSAAGGIFPCKATVDEFRIWNRVRTQEEIQQTMNRSLDPEPALAARMRFDEGSGTSTNGLNPPPAILTSAATWTASQAMISCVRGSLPNAPTPLTPQGTPAIPAHANVIFAWTAVGGADAYQLQIGLKNDFLEPVATIGNIHTTTHVHGALASNTSYYWRVRAVGANGAGPWSQPVLFSTKPPCTDNVLVLNGEGTYVEIPTFTWQSRAVTVECWLYVDSVDVRNSWLFYTAPADSADRLSAHAPWSDKILSFDYGAYGGGGRLQTNYADYIGKWTHVAMVSNGRDLKEIYLNGKRVASAALARRPRWPRQGLMIGGNRNTPFFKGKLTEFRVWNTARTESAIRENMHRRLNGPQSGLVGYWRLDGTRDSMLQDLSGFGNNGVVRNGATWEPLTPLGPYGTSIDGPSRVVRGSDGNTYRSADSTLTGYQWSVTGGAIITGQGTSAVTIDWGAGDEGIVSLTGTTASGCDITAALLVAISEGSTVAVAGSEPELGLVLHPNPTRDEITVRFDAPAAAPTLIEVYTSTGERVLVFDAGRCTAGANSVVLPVRDLPSGHYFCQVRAGTMVGRASMQVVR